VRSLTEKKFPLFRAVLLIVGAVLLSPSARAATGAEVPRVILGLYDGGNGGQLEFSRLHRMAAMLLNHLGLLFRYHDIQDGLPPADALKGARGVLTWLPNDRMADPEGYLDWAEHVVDQGYTFVILGQMGFTQSAGGTVTPAHRINRFFEPAGAGAERQLPRRHLRRFGGRQGPGHGRVRTHSSDGAAALRTDEPDRPPGKNRQ